MMEANLLIPDVAHGVHLIQYANVNCWLLEDEQGLTLIDAGLPRTRHQLDKAVATLGYQLSDIRALVLTHAHFDHVGMAHQLTRDLDLPVFSHPEEKELAAHPYRYDHENPIPGYPLRYPRAIPGLVSMLFAGAGRVRGVDEIESFAVGDTLEVPGAPQVIATPGHTYGHVALHLPDRDAVITGDALVTLDPYTALAGPRVVAGAATADEQQALASLDAIADTDAQHVLPGHGDPWGRGAARAAEAARRNGMA